MKMLKNKKSGFTMIEIMLVVLVIGLLVALAFKGFGGQGEKAKAKISLQMISSMQNSINTFVADYGSVPAAWGGTDNAVASVAETQALLESLSGRYTGADTALATHSAKFPVCQFNEDLATLAAKYRIAITSNSGVKRVAVLQYREDSNSPVINGNKTVGAALVAAAATVTASNPFSANDFVVGGAGTATAWPY